MKWAIPSQLSISIKIASESNVCIKKPSNTDEFHHIARKLQETKFRPFHALCIQPREDIEVSV